MVTLVTDALITAHEVLAVTVGAETAAGGAFVNICRQADNIPRFSFV